MAREFLPGIFWIQECGGNLTAMVRSLTEDPQGWYQPGREIHIPQNAYLFMGDRTLLFDTLSPASRLQIIQELRDILDDRPLDYLVVSHTDTPHAGNTHAILHEYPDATLVAPAYGDTHELYHLEDALKVREGDVLDLGGHRLRFYEATFLDAAISIWMKEENTNMLLTVDWMGLPHMAGECLKCVDELQSEVNVRRLVEFHGRVFFWLQYVDAPKTLAVIDWVTRKLKPSIIAPAHGLVFRRDAEKYMLMMKEAVEYINTHGRVGVVG